MRMRPIGFGWLRLETRAFNWQKWGQTMQRSIIKRMIESGFYASILTLSGFGFYYPVGLIFTLAQGGDPVKFFIDSMIGGFFAFLFFWFLCWEISGMFERANQRRHSEYEEPTSKQDKDKKQDEDGKDPHN